MEPSPLSSPAFSAYSNASTIGGTDDNDDDDDDVDEIQDGIKVDLNEPESPKMSPGAKARAVSSSLRHRLRRELSDRTTQDS